MKPDLPPEEIGAVIDFASKNGRNWKSALRECWMSGQYPADVDAPALQRVRNAAGPSWLISFRLPAAKR